MSLHRNIINDVTNLPRFVKQIIAILCDTILCFLSVLIAYYLRLDQFVPLKGPILTAIWFSIFFAIPIFWLTGLYRTIFRYSGFSIMLSVSVAVLVYGILYLCIFSIYQIDGVPRSIGIIQPMLLFFGIVCSRLFIKFILEKTKIKKKN